MYSISPVLFEYIVKEYSYQVTFLIYASVGWYF